MLWVPLLLVACAAAVLSSVRLCLAAVTAARPAPPEFVLGEDRDPGRELTLAEAAYLSGGPLRVADLTLVSMHRARRLLLAHTGWATVVDPEGRDDLERSVIGAIGPDGQARTTAIRPAVAAADAVRTVADRLVTAGLAVPEPGRRSVAAGVRAVFASLVLSLALAAGAVLILPQGVSVTPVLAWFSLPVVLTLGCLLAARAEAHPYPHWASPAGQVLLGEVPAADDPMAALATRGPRALADPGLRAALDAR
ncbi:TIGR04222 domain-containing membrane protein [Streptomyces solicathayae]|uniref:TIGR04222 domain-containing membrane protein n=1 Tax=Streptomyces solicathayae TaxID=3081768 RepID=A0ABZ0LQC7_9ACTN|nr:TIGR04222 domain-containing membrane protein [Streptomyces sp. HUAS YS2]WOX21495.1 TIGR04222 domain-containing membrane protein [Streptomyces sp. HUAS YS2]